MLFLANAVHAASPGEARIPEQTRQVIEQAHRSLASGDPAEAADLFEKAASHGEFVDAEVGEVRARLWAGQFRHAVAISNVVAGEHPESAEAQALLAYIEDRNGYTAQALERLRRESSTHPGALEPVLAEAEILIDRHQATRALELIDRRITEHGPQADLCQLRARARTLAATESAAPGCDPGKSKEAGRSRWFEFTPALPVGRGAPLRAGNGLIIEGGTHVATSQRLIEGPPAAWWVRNFRGELRRVYPESGVEEARLTHGETRKGEARHENQSASPENAGAVVVLKLESPFPTEQSVREIAPGGVHGLCFSLSYPAPASVDPMLPAVTPCFAFAQQGSEGTLQVNVPLSPMEQGSPVFDAQGRLLGLAMPAPATRTTVIRVPGTESSATGAGGVQSAATVPMPELYERLAPALVQVLAYAQ